MSHRCCRTVRGTAACRRSQRGNREVIVRRIGTASRAASRACPPCAQGPQRKITVNVKDEILELNNTIAMVDRLNAFASEVGRVARERPAPTAMRGLREAPATNSRPLDRTWRPERCTAKPPRFGSTVVKTMAESSLDGNVDLEFAPAGPRWQIVCPRRRCWNRPPTCYRTRESGRLKASSEQVM
jgi:hypothetical protein